MTFLDELQKNTNYTYTENGALAYKTTLDPVLDYFALAGAMRDRVAESARLFEKAYICEPELAVRALFYLRDIRGGQGERDVFIAGLDKLKTIDNDVYNSVLKFVPEYGRWADLFVGGITPEITAIVGEQLLNDEIAMANGESVSLLAKWLPSENASSKDSRNKALAIASGLGLSPRQYRVRVVALRKYIDLLEQKMSDNKWGDIDYSKVPSQAFRKHTKAFTRHDGTNFSAFLSKAQNGEVKLNTSTLFTYEVFDEVGRGNVDAANAMWENLPDYTNGKNALVLADVSGSMWGRPMSVSVSLALYFAERNQGPFNGYFMTFSADPQLVKVKGKNLCDRLEMIESSEWGMNTNLNKALYSILDAAVKAEASQDEIPSTLYIISDMQFDSCVSGTNLDSAKKKFAEAGYKLPHVVFWNVSARNTQVPATILDGNVTLISGFSQSSFRYAVEGKSAQEFMIEVLTSDRYSNITI